MYEQEAADSTSCRAGGPSRAATVCAAPLQAGPCEVVCCMMQHTSSIYHMSLQVLAGLCNTPWLAFEQYLSHELAVRLPP